MREGKKGRKEEVGRIWKKWILKISAESKGGRNEERRK